jgi:uncharacterized protein YfaS (alpha-2-macroglobulin family)
MSRLLWQKLLPVVTACTLFFLVTAPAINLCSLDAAGNSVARADEEEKAGSGSLDPNGDFEASLESSKDGLDFKLSEGKPVAQAEVTEKPPVVNGESLSEEETCKLLKLLPPLEEEKLPLFVLPARSLPVPNSQNRLPESFPAPRKTVIPPAVTPTALKVISKRPIGALDRVNEVSLSFSEPMVPLSTQEQVAAVDVPVKMTPKIAGQWVWYGTHTLIFQPGAKALPMATKFSLTVPQGTKSINGSVLGKEESWSFSTGKPHLTSSYPDGSGSYRPTTCIMARFSQKIDHDALLKVTRVEANKKTFGIRPATEEEIAADPEFKKHYSDARAGTAIAFKTIETLPSNTQIHVKFGPGVKSMEGSLLQDKADECSFRTYGPFHIMSNAGVVQVIPTEDCNIQFSNRLDEKTVSNSRVKVTPPIPDMKVSSYSDSIQINGSKEPRTKYHIEVARTLKDEFGQTLSGLNTRDFQVKSVEKDLYMPSSIISLLSRSRPHFSIQTINLDSLNFKVYAAAPAQFETSGYYSLNKSATLLHKGKLQIKNVKDKTVVTSVDLTPWLKDSRGILIFTVSTKGLWNGYGGDDDRICWIQCTNLALNTYSDGRKMYAWTTDMGTGAPVGGAIVHTSNGRSLPTNADGLVSFTCQGKDSEHCVWASHGKDQAIAVSVFDVRKPGKDNLNWYIVTDRSPYRPGEIVNVKGMVRKKSDSPTENLSLIPNLRKLSFQVFDNTRNILLKGNTDVNQFGAFDLSFKLPQNMNLGNATLSLNSDSSDKLDSTTHEENIPVQEFRRPEFEVTVRNEGESTHMIGSTTTLSTTTSYFSGGGLPGSEITWNGRATSTTYSPPGWTEFAFGRSTSPLGWYRNSARAYYTSRRFTTKTDKDGKSFLKVDFLKVTPIEPTSIDMSATVTDVNHQTWTANTTLLVHPSKLYVGTKFAKPFVQQGSSQKASFIVTDVDGKVQADTTIKVEVWRKNETWHNGQCTESKDDLQNFDVTSKSDAAELEITPKLNGLYILNARVADKDGHANETETQFWVAGNEPVVKQNPDANFHSQELIILPEKKAYNPGDEAKIMIESPFAPANGVARILHNGIAKVVSFRMDTTTYELRVPVTEDLIPSISVAVGVVGQSPRSATMNQAPAEAIGSVDIAVSDATKRLTVEALPQSVRTEPGKDTSIKIKVTDKTGRVVPNAEVTLAVVDDALLSLVDYKFKDPFEVFYSKPFQREDYFLGRGTLDMTGFFLNDKDKQKRSSLPAAPPPPPMSAAYPGAASAGAGGDAWNIRNNWGLFHKAGLSLAALPPPSALPPPPMPRIQNEGPLFHDFREPIPDTQYQIIERFNPPPGLAAPVSVNLRSNFDALAKWVPSVITDESGTATVRFKLPDNLTRYRIMVVASQGNDRFGTGESSLTARLSLMLKPSAPRFLNYGDKFELPLVVHNQTDTPIEINLAARATNIKFLKGQGRHATVPPNDRVEIRLPAETQHSGKAKFQAVVAFGATTDAAEFDLPVYTPATTEAFATYGQIDKGAIQQQLVKPEDILPDYGELQVSTSSTILETITDAFLYVHHYPHECSEQLSSRLIAISLLKDVLKEFHVKDMPTEAQIKESVKDALAKLKNRQRPTGGFALWSLSDKHTYPYVSLHVLHALLLAKQAGHDVSDQMLEGGLEYARNIESHIKDDRDTSRQELKAFAYYLLDLSGNTETAGARRLYKSTPVDKTPLETLGWYLSIFCHHKQCAAQADEIHRYLINHMVETASTADISFTEDKTYLDWTLMWSPMRTKGLLLDALIKEDKSPELATKLMRTILGGQENGRWSNTQANVYVLQAIKHYFDTYEKKVPDFVVQSWLDNEYTGESSFKGRSNDYKTISVPMSYVEKLKNRADIILEKKGEGRAYYRLGMSYAPRDLHLAQLDRGFHLTRTYEGVKNKSDASKDNNGRWHFKAGSLVKVKLTLSSPAYRNFVALVDAIPAGTEIINENMNGAEHTDSDNDSNKPGIWSWWWSRDWFDHENKRDNQDEIFADHLSGGTHDYQYVVRATTPGTFVVPPSKVEEMYAPETFGRTQTETVVVE